jgi:hypothetical protein
MKTQIKNQIQTVVLATVIGAVFPWSGALGDNLNPPSYVGNPLSVHAEWQLVAGTTGLNLIQSNSVDDTDPATVLSSVPFSFQVKPNSTNQYQFQLPNWIDQMPEKYMRLQLTWQGTAQPPLNVVSNGLDNGITVPGGIAAVSPIYTMLTGYYQYFDFIFKPNPDSERIGVQLPPDGHLTQVVVDTVSTPEPATMGLLALGGLAIRFKKYPLR